MRTKTGTVVSNRMSKTVVVAVVTDKLHPKYLKRYKVTTKYYAHDEQGQYQVGDRVTIAECRPLSKLKRWRVVSTPASSQS